MHLFQYTGIFKERDHFTSESKSSRYTDYMFVATNTHVKNKVGWTLIILSGVPWMLMFAIPWTNIPHPVIVTAALYGLSQLMWIVGVWCVGREVLTRVKELVLRHPFCHSASEICKQVSQKRLIHRQDPSTTPHPTGLFKSQERGTINSDTPSNETSH